MSRVQSLFWRRVTSLRRGAISTGGGAFLLEDTTFCGGVYFDLEEGSSSFGVGGHTLLEEGCIFDCDGRAYFHWMKGAF